MKKLLFLVLSLVLVFSHVACSENDSNTSGTSKTTDKGNTDNLTTIEGWLSYWNLAEEDLRCANFTRLDKTTYSSKTGVISEIGIYINKELTNNEVSAWLEKIISKLNSISEEGRITNYEAHDELLAADWIMSRTLHIGSGEFTYKGKKVNTMICVLPDCLDSYDADDAACTIRLMH